MDGIRITGTKCNAEGEQCIPQEQQHGEECSCLECNLGMHKFEIPGGTIYEDEYVLVHATLDPHCRPSFVVAPRNHKKGLDDVGEENCCKLASAMSYLQSMMRKGKIASMIEETIDSKMGHLKLIVTGADDGSYVNVTSFLRNVTYLKEMFKGFNY